MPLKDILVHLDTTERSQARLRLAVALARRDGAHLTGLHVVDVMLPILSATDVSGGGAAVLEALEEMRRDAVAAAAVETTFRERLRADGIAGEWRFVEGITSDQVAFHARYADLAALGQPGPEGAAWSSNRRCSPPAVRCSSFRIPGGSKRWAAPC
jgi:nucleotide-binding universal stress UspA family protein